MTNCIVFQSPKEITYRNLCILKPIHFSKNQKAFPIRYLPNKEPIIILTGNMGVNYGSYSYSNYTDCKYLDIFLNRKSWEYDQITYLNSCLTRMMKLNKVIPSNYKFVSSIKNDKKIALKLSEDFKIFNKNNDKIDSKIKVNFSYKLAVVPHTIWCSSIKKQYGIEWKLVQMREYYNDTQECVFPNDNPINIPPPPPLPPPPPPLPLMSEGTNKNNPDYIKFFKMIQVGIPLQAVVIKMSISLNISSSEAESILNNPNQIISNNSNANNSDSNSARMELMNAIKGNVKLRKVSIDNTKKTEENKNNNNGRTTINLDEILNIKSKLKKREQTRSYWK